MGRSLEPADLAGATLEGLAAAGEIKMLAAVAKLGSRPVAVSALGVLAAMPDSFSWWWAAVRECPATSVAEWNTAANLPASTVMPEEFADEVTEFILQPGSQSGPRDGARVALFRALADDDTALMIARRVLGSPTLPDLETRAADLLGRFGPDDRAAVVTAATRGGRPACSAGSPPATIDS